MGFALARNLFAGLLDVLDVIHVLESSCSCPGGEGSGSHESACNRMFLAVLCSV